MRKAVTMQDIADKVGVSVVAVSKALSGQKGVSAELRSRIKRTADHMGYASRQKPQKKTAASNNVGIITAERYFSDHSFYFSFLKEITSLLQARSSYAFFHTLTRKNEEELILPDIIFSQRVDGIIILGQISEEYTKAVIDTGIPTVFLDFYNELTADRCIVSDSFYGVYEMTNYLIKNGHRQIAFVGNIHTTSSIQDRYLGYEKSLIEHNIPLKDYFIISDRETESGNPIPIELPLIMPTAFVCNCDETACRLVTHLKESGYRVPEDISVTGFDNSVFSSISVPNITTVAVNVEQMSELAVEELFKNIEKPGSFGFGMIRVKGKMILRESVREIGE